MKTLTIQIPDDVHAKFDAHGLINSPIWGEIIAALMPILLKLLGGAGGTPPKA